MNEDSVCLTCRHLLPEEDDYAAECKIGNSENFGTECGCWDYCEKSRKQGGTNGCTVHCRDCKFWNEEQAYTLFRNEIEYRFSYCSKINIHTKECFACQEGERR